jgi:selenocysteine lyase/cysteine desulfurase
MGIDLLALPGHKGLLGPMGVGALYVGPTVQLDTLIEGGAGGDSASDQAPTELPDRFEPGTLNLPGISGLHAGVELVSAEGVLEIGARERALGDRLRTGLAAAALTALVSGTIVAGLRLGMLRRAPVEVDLRNTSAQV